MRTAIDLCVRFAVAPWPVLLVGEPGTGKSVFAEYMHQHSNRSGGFIKRSLGSHVHELEYDTLAGHVTGSFTGAMAERKGMVEEAHQGTLFLDEIALAPPSVQEMLLELLDSGHLHRLGENRSRPVSVRLIFATNADLAVAVSEQRFRQDLLDRIGHLRIVLPPLRTRRDEIIPLARRFLSSHARIFTNYHPVLSPESERRLLQSEWPGNVRGLETAMQYCVLMAHPSLVVAPEHLPLETGPDLAVLRRDQTPTAQDIVCALADAGGSKSEAARQLGISRNYLYTLMRRRAS
jgi:two-component system, NtrC family, response regulator HydG